VVRDGELFARPDALAPRVATAGRLRTVEDLPGPRGLPLLGNLLALDLQRMHEVLERWAAHHGPVFGDVLQRKLELIFPGVNRRLFAPVPWWRIVKLPADRVLERAVGEVFSLLRELLSAARASLAAEPERASHPETFLEAMVCARDDTGQPFSDGVILGNAFQMLLAGEDTTALTLCWSVHESCDAPRVVAKLEGEADEVLGEALVPPDLTSVGHLQVAGAVASETMRLRPVAPLLFLEANMDTMGPQSLRVRLRERFRSLAPDARRQECPPIT